MIMARMAPMSTAVISTAAICMAIMRIVTSHTTITRMITLTT
jgi:hypothetical protein